MNKKIDTWMFRESGELAYLAFSIFIVFLLGILIAKINIYLFLGALALGIIYIKLQQAQLIGNALEISDNQFSEINEFFKEYKQNLALDKVKLYINQDPNPNAFTIGFPTASIILASSLVENFTDEELKFTVAHELGHVKAAHNIILTFINPLGSKVIGSALIFSFWKRKAEYSADKCALIITKNLDAGVSSLLKLTVGLKLAKKVKLESYKEQLINSKTNVVAISEWLFDHPLTTNRISRMVHFWHKNFIYQ